MLDRVMDFIRAIATGRVLKSVVKSIFAGVVTLFVAANVPSETVEALKTALAGSEEAITAFLVALIVGLWDKAKSKKE